MPTKSKKQNQLGRALMKSRFHHSGPRGPHMNPDGSIRHTTDMNDSAASWTRYQSITQENDLEAFLNTAQLANAEFTAERLNVQVISSDALHSTSTHNPFLLNDQEKIEALAKHDMHRDKLRVPRRPCWDKSTTAEELKASERESFLDWRRSLAVLEETLGLLLTPYERNLEVWRQMWRVIERSDMVVQIVDARNPLLFRSVDLEAYVKEVDMRKKNLLLINKADMLTGKQRMEWAKYFDEHDIKYTFFSAALAKKKQEDEREENLEQENGKAESVSTSSEDSDIEELENEETVFLDKIKIRSVEELLDLFMEECPKPLRVADTKSTIGFIGYPNVGKSSTLNALCGAKRVAVASTPGKTKHFQTIHIPPLPLILCDCPGLVFPSFATTKADMVTNGILPIDQLREHTGPSALVAQRFPKAVLEKVYGIRIKTRDEEGVEVERTPTAEELLRSYAISRGYTKSSQGNPDEARAARYILKDYVNGKLLFAFPPPGIDEQEFNRLSFIRFLASTTRSSMISSRLLGLADLAAEMENLHLLHDASPTFESHVTESDGRSSMLIPKNKKEVVAHTVGKFASSNVTRTTLYPTQRMVSNENAQPLVPPHYYSEKGKCALERDSERIRQVMSSGNRLSGAPTSLPQDKKHKKKKNVKQRTRWTADDY